MSKKDFRQYKAPPKKPAQLLKKNNLNRKIFYYLLFIIILTAGVYSNSLHNDFANWDDDPQIVNNADIKSLSFESVKKLFSNYYVGMYQPLTSLSFAIEYRFFGLNPLPYHVNNLILHLLNVIFVFFFIWILTRKINAAGIVALIFGIHPMHVESVAWVTERKDVLYSFFFIPGLITYIYYLKKQKLLYLLMTYLLFLLSLFTKSAAVCFPLVIVLLDYYYKTKYNIKEIISRIPLFILSAIFGYVAVHSQESSGAIADLTPSYNIFERVFLACYSLSFYIIKLFIPAGLCAMHYFPEKSGNVLPSEYYLSALLISGIVIALILVKSPKYKMHLIFGLLFFLATIIMVIQIIPIGFAITAERYTYLPYIGLTIPIGIVLHDIIEDKTNKLYKSRNIFIITLIAFTAGFSATTYSRNKVWRDGIALFTDVIEKNPKKFHGYWIRGSAYSNKKDYKMAIADFDKTLQCKPPNAAEVLNNRGNAKNNIDDYEGAFKDLNEAIRINPKLAEAYSNRGSARDNLGDYKGAMEDYDKALSLKPEMITAYNNRGVTKGKIALSKGGDIQKNMQPAIDDFNTAIKINPYDPSSYLNRGNAKGFLRDFQGSLHDFNIAVKLGPKEHQAYFNRGITKLNLKDTAGACADWQKASELGSKSAKELVNNLCNRF